MWNKKDRKFWIFGVPENVKSGAIHLLSWCHIICQPVATEQEAMERSEVESQWERKGLASPLINKVGQEQGNLHPSLAPSLSLCAPPSDCRWGSHTWRWRVHSSLILNLFPIRICIHFSMCFVWSICSNWDIPSYERHTVRRWRKVSSTLLWGHGGPTDSSQSYTEQDELSPWLPGKHNTIFGIGEFAAGGVASRVERRLQLVPVQVLIGCVQLNLKSTLEAHRRTQFYISTQQDCLYARSSLHMYTSASVNQGN